MNVAYVSNVVYPFVPGGAQKRIYEIGTRLVDRGHDVTVYGRHYWDGPEKTTYDGIRLRAVSPARELYTGDRRSIGEAVEFATALWGPLGAHIDEHDVLVASVFPYFPVFAAALRARNLELPLVTTWHECWRDYWYDYLGLLGFGGKVVERAVAKLPQVPIAVSPLTADRLAEIGPSRDRIRVVPNGVDVDRVRAAEPAEAGHDVLYVGRLVETKNVDRLLRGFATVDRAASLGIVGDGPERSALQALASDLGIESSVEFHGQVAAYESVLSHLRAADVFVSPSVREGFGITVLEAMAADCTVVAARAPTSAAASIVGDAAFLVEPTAGALGRKLEGALAGVRPTDDPIGHARQYEWDAITESALEVYSRAIETQRSNVAPA